MNKLIFRYKKRSKETYLIEKRNDLSQVVLDYGFPTAKNTTQSAPSIEQNK